jgi:hypothetical protein
MEEILSNIGYFLLQVLGVIGAIYFFYIVYFRSKTNIDDDDLDRVIKGGDKG